MRMVPGINVHIINVKVNNYFGIVLRVLLIGIIHSERMLGYVTIWKCLSEKSHEDGRLDNVF
jgi:hypothetical protein